MMRRVINPAKPNASTGSVRLRITSTQNIKAESPSHPSLSHRLSLEVKSRVTGDPAGHFCRQRRQLSTAHRGLAQLGPAQLLFGRPVTLQHATHQGNNARQQDAHYSETNEKDTHQTNPPPRHTSAPQLS
jgi:hypothetical protein